MKTKKSIQLVNTFIEKTKQITDSSEHLTCCKASFILEFLNSGLLTINLWRCLPACCAILHPKI